MPSSPNARTRTLIARLRRAAVAAVAAASAFGCTSPTASVVDGSVVRVQNVSTRTFERVEVHTAEDAQFVVGPLAPNAVSGYQSVAKIHENPLVTVRAGGRDVTANPVEGFVEGFNRTLPEGRYTLRLGMQGDALVPELVRDADP
jgi:hypothetical protein